MRSSFVVPSWLLTPGGRALLFMWVGLSACQQPVDPAPPEPVASEAPAPVVSPPFDVADVVRRVGLAFKAEGTRFTSAQATYAVEVGGGRVTFQPGALRQRQEAKAVRGAALSLETVGLGGRGLRLRWWHEWRPWRMEGLASTGAVGCGRRCATARRAWSRPGRPEGGGPGVRYGLATWVDARGVRTPLGAPRFERDEVVLEVPDALLASSAYPAVLDPLVSPESDVVPPGPVPAPLVQRQAQVASDGTGFLVVWEDERHGTGGRIYATRVGASGAVLDPKGIALSSTATGQTPVAAFDGSRYLVAWFDPATWRIKGIRVAPTGQVLDPAPFNLSTQSAYPLAPAVAADASSFLPPRTFSTVGGQQSNADVAFDGQNYLVAWNDSRADVGDIFAARVDPTGRVLDPAGIAVARVSGSYQLEPRVAVTSSGFLVAWRDYRSTTGGPHIYAAVVTRDGQVPRAGVGLRVGTRAQEEPAVASDGTDVLVVWRELDGSGGATLEGALVGGATGTTRRAVTVSNVVSTTRSPSVAFSGSSYLVTWVDLRGTSPGPGTYANRVDRAGNVLGGTSGFLLGATPGSISEVDVAAGPDGFLMARTASSEEGRRVYVNRLALDGRLVDTQALSITAPVVGADDPEVVFDGTNYVVAWHQGADSLDIRANRVSPGGVVLDGTGFTVSAAPGVTEATPALASDGAGGVLVAYAAEAEPRLRVFHVKTRFIRFLRVGQACQAAGDCDSGFCVDGVCCATACGGGVATGCQACSVAAGAGVDDTCSPVGRVPGGCARARGHRVPCRRACV